MTSKWLFYCDGEEVVKEREENVPTMTPVFLSTQYSSKFSYG